jgi:hypothetical protein
MNWPVFILAMGISETFGALFSLISFSDASSGSSRERLAGWLAATLFAIGALSLAIAAGMLV